MGAFFIVREETVHASVTEAKIQQSRSDEALGILHGVVLPNLREQKGFRGFILLIDPETQNGMTISFWETEAEMTEFQRSGLPEDNLARFLNLFARPAMTDSYEVNLFEFPAS